MAVKSPSLIKAGVIITIILLISLLAFKFFIDKKCQGLFCLNFPGIRSYRIKEIYQSDDKSYRGLYSNGKNEIRLNVEKNIKSENAKEETSILIAKMDKLYEKQRSPYPGEISDTIICADEFIPKWQIKKNGDTEINYTFAYLNDRYVYGACTEDQLKYKSLFAVFYCQNQNGLYQLEIINDKNEFDKYIDTFNSIVEGVKCK